MSLKILLLVAASGAGKTTACQKLVELAKDHDLNVTGVLSIPVYDSLVKSAINLVDATSSNERTLARVATPGVEPDVGIWSFEPEAILWGQALLDGLPACDLLVIDEIGPLEIKLGKGLTNALAALRRANYRLAVVSLRPALIEALLKLLPSGNISVYWVNEGNRNLLPDSIIAELEKDQCREIQIPATPERV